MLNLKCKRDQHQIDTSSRFGTVATMMAPSSPRQASNPGTGHTRCFLQKPHPLVGGPIFPAFVPKDRKRIYLLISSPLLLKYHLFFNDRI